MIIEREFFSGGYLRWNLGWPTPNYAGAFLVTLLALAFVFSGSRWRWAVLAMEAGGLFLLAKTYSRGAILAWGLAWLLGVAASRGWRDARQRLLWGGRAVVLAALMLAVGFEWNRAAGDGTATRDHRASASDGPAGRGITQEDGSVVNRLALWRGGLQMATAAPLAGWGAGESGRAYMNWFQDLERSEGYTTMVNSYLHVAVERGLPALALVLFVIGLLMIVAWTSARNDASAAVRPCPNRAQVAMGAGASLLGWAIVNVFTTLWIEPRLWIVPVVAVSLLGWSAWPVRTKLLKPSMILAGCMSALLVSGLYGAGQWLRKESLLRIETQGDTVIAGRSGAGGEEWHAWPDAAVLGATPGKEFRRWLLDKDAPSMRLIVHPLIQRQPASVSAGVGGVLLFGRQARRLDRDLAPRCDELWIIHPTVPPAGTGQTLLPEITVVLPQVDIVGNGPAWRNWSNERGARIIISPDCGLDIRAAWPEVLMSGGAGGEIASAP